MKSLEELAAIRNKMQNVVNLRSEASDCTRIVVGMATCGIAAGARPVLKAFSDDTGKGHKRRNGNTGRLYRSLPV